MQSSIQPAVELTSSGLLDGVRILDLTKLAAALATCRLADLGADVIKIEGPPYGDYYRSQPPFVARAGMGLAFLMVNRNKRSIGLDLKTAKGRAIFEQLLHTADVVVEVSRPGRLARIGLDYEALRQVKPDIVYCSISGYGQSGLYRELPSHGMNVDASAGMVRIERGPGGRPEIGPFSSYGLSIDLGALHAALAVTAALFHRAQTGEGQYIDTSCWAAGVASNSRFAAALNLGSASEAVDAEGRGGVGARYNVYGTKDDQVIFLCPLEKDFWQSFCEVVDRPQWIERGDWENPMDFGDELLRTDIEAVMRTKTLDEWMPLFTEAGVPASPVIEPDQLEHNAHTIDRRMVIETDDSRYRNVKWVAPPFCLPGHEFKLRHPSPELGEDSEAILTELRYEAHDIARLVAEGIVTGAMSKVVSRNVKTS